MAYTKTAWNDQVPPPISAANLNKLETQYDEAVATAAAYADSRTRDTGWRDITPLMQQNGWAVTIANIRRLGGNIFFRMIVINGTNATAARIGDLPEGFRMGADGHYVPLATGAKVTTLLVDAGRYPSLPYDVGTTSATGAWALTQWSTVDAFPATLPGTATT